jgi:hypothetical protein
MKVHLKTSLSKKAGLFFKPGRMELYEESFTRLFMSFPINYCPCADISNNSSMTFSLLFEKAFTPQLWRYFGENM